MNKEKASKVLFLSLFIVYLLNIFSRYSFSTVSVDLVNTGILTKTEIGYINGLFWLTYAIGQIPGGLIANRISPYGILVFSSVSSGICNILMFCVNSFLPMLIIWTVHGITQIAIWPSIVRLFSEQILPEERGRAFSLISYSGPLGYLLSYFITALVLLILPWKSIFICCASVTLIIIPIVLFCRFKASPVLQKACAAEEPPAKVKKGKLLPCLKAKYGILIVSVSLLIATFLDQSIKTWAPIFFSETYSLGSSYSLFLSVFILAVNLLGVLLIHLILKKFKGDLGKTILFTTVILFLLIVPMLFFRVLGVFTVIAVLSCFCMVMTGDKQVYSIAYPAYFQRMRLTTVLSSFLNCFASFGVMFASYGSGAIADTFGWDALIYVWIGFSILLVVLAVLLIPPYRRLRKEIE